jgi:heterotetrameric sarcosine oxidase gamma subunit
MARSPLHHWHAAHGAHFAERDGWQVVTRYTDARAEAEAARSGVGVADISAFAKISLRGAGVPDLVRALAPDGPAMKPHGVAAFPSGEALVCRLTDDHLLVLGAAPEGAALRQQLARLGEGRQVVQTDATSAYAGFWMLGPHVEEVLRRLTQLDVRPAALPEGSCAEAALAGVEALLVRLAGLALPSVRVYVAWDMAEYVWERVLEAGRGGLVAPLGSDALAVLCAT